MTCERCKVNMNQTEIKGVYKCPICGVIDNDRLNNEH